MILHSGHSTPRSLTHFWIQISERPTPASRAVTRVAPIHRSHWGSGNLADMTTIAGYRASISSRGIFSIHVNPIEILGDQHRLGELALAGRQKVQTPNYFPLTSRGSLPHLSQDMMRDHAPVAGIYTALEDCEFPFDSGPSLEGLISVLFLEPVRHRKGSFRCSTHLQNSGPPSYLPP